MRGTPSQASAPRWSRTGCTVISRATAPTLRLTVIGVTLSSRRCSHSAARTSSPSVHGRGVASPAASQGNGRRDDDLLPELVEHDGAGEGLVAAERGDDVGLVALGLAGEIETQLVRPGRTDGAMRQVAGRVQAPAQLGESACRAPTWRCPSGSSSAPAPGAPATGRAWRERDVRATCRARRRRAGWSAPRPRLPARRRACRRSARRQRAPASPRRRPRPARVHSPPRRRRAAGRR